MSKTYTIEIDDALVADFERSNACTANGGADGLFQKVVIDAVQEVRRSEAQVTPVVEPDPTDVTVTVE